MRKSKKHSCQGRYGIIGVFNLIVACDRCASSFVTRSKSSLEADAQRLGWVCLKRSDLCPEHAPPQAPRQEEPEQGVLF